jgi:type II secretory pathway pseudopilin PulG
MPTLSAGKTKPFLVCRFLFLVSAPRRASERETRNQKPEAGITLIETMVVVVLISLMAGIAFPAIMSGVDSLRLNQATTSVVAFVNSGLSRAERREQVVEITISKHDNALFMRSTEKGFFRKLELPDGITLTHVLPEIPEAGDAPRSFLLYPGGAAPRFGVQLANRRNVERIVRVDPITGVPRVEQP